LSGEVVAFYESIVPYARLLIVTKSVTNQESFVIFEPMGSQRKWKNDASKSYCNPFFNTL